MNLTHFSKNLVLSKWLQHRYLKEWAERGPKVACIHLTLGRTDLHLKMALGCVTLSINGIIGGPRVAVILQSLSILSYEPPPIRSRELEGGQPPLCSYLLTEVAPQRKSSHQEANIF